MGEKVDQIEVEEASEEEKHPQEERVVVPEQRHHHHQPTLLSKSWSIQKVHGPIYTGGKLVFGQNNILFTSVNGDVVLTDYESGQKIGSIRGREKDALVVVDDDDDVLDKDAIVCFCVAQNNNMVLTCSQNSLIRQYRIDDDNEHSRNVKLIKVWGKSGHTLPVTRMEWDETDVFCATGSVDGSVRIWDVRGGFVTHVFRGSNSKVTAIAWYPHHHQLVLAIGREDGSITIHDLRKKTPIVLADHDSAVTSMVWDTTHQTFLTAGRDSVVNLWKRVVVKDAETYRKLHTLPLYEEVECIMLIPFQFVATAGSKGKVRLWRIEAETDEGCRLVPCAEQADSFGKGGFLHMARHTIDRVDVIAVADAEHNISVLSIDDTTIDNVTIHTNRTIVGHNDDILDLKVIPDGTDQRIVIATNSSVVRIFDLTTFAACQVLDLHTATVLCVNVSPCGRFIATCGKDKTMRIWHADMCVALAEGHTEAVGSAALSRKVGRYEVGGKASRNGGGAFAVTVSVDRTLKRWNLPSATEMEQVTKSNGDEFSLKAVVSTRAHEKDINIVSIAPNDSLIATGSQDKTVKLWKATDLAQVATLKGHRRGVWDCQFSPFDRVLATGSGDKTIKLWSLSDFSCIRTLQGHVATVLRVRFLSGGLQLVSSGADGLIKLWTVRTNETEATLDSHTDKIWALDLTSSGKELISGGGDSQIVVWEDTTKEVQDSQRAADEEAILDDQALANHLRNKNYSEALEHTLKRDKPHQVLKILNATIEAELQRGESGFDVLKRYVQHWDMERIVQVLRYCREWNTRARNSHVALLVVKAVVSTIPINELAETEGVPEIIAGMIPYAERHLERIDRLHSNTYLLDFALSSMGAVEPSNMDEDFSAYEASVRLVLPPKRVDGRIDVGGKVIVGTTGADADKMDDSDNAITVGDSESDDE